MQSIFLNSIWKATNWKFSQLKLKPNILQKEKMLNEEFPLYDLFVRLLAFLKFKHSKRECQDKYLLLLLRLFLVLDVRPLHQFSFSVLRKTFILTSKDQILFQFLKHSRGKIDDKLDALLHILRVQKHQILDQQYICIAVQVIMVTWVIIILHLLQLYHLVSKHRLRFKASL